MPDLFWITVIAIIYLSDSIANAIPDSKGGFAGGVRKVLRFISLKPRNAR